MSLNLHDAYGPQHERMVRAHQEAGDEKADLSAERSRWPDLKQEVTDDVLPIVADWRTQLHKNLKPLKFKPLRKKARGLKGLLKIAIFNRGAFRVRLENALMRLTLLLIALIKLAVALGIIYGVIKLVDAFTG